MHNLNTSGSFEEGAIILIDKAKGWSSFDVVRKVRNLTSAKCGHGGTLDPLATGLMIVATGKFTKKLTSLTNLDKVYTGCIYLGATTPSYDRETAEDATYPISHITSEKITEATQKLTGKIIQTPPVHSAIKIDGKPSYAYARKGQARVLKPREQEVYTFDIVKIELPLVYFHIHCSKGTYIRSLANDFGQLLSSGGYLYELRREQSGEFKIENAFTIEKFEEYITQIKLKQKT